MHFLGPNRYHIECSAMGLCVCVLLYLSSYWYGPCILRDRPNAYFIAHYYHSSFRQQFPKAEYLNSNYICIKWNEKKKHTHQTIAISVSPISLSVAFFCHRSSLVHWTWFNRNFLETKKKLLHLWNCNRFYITHQFQNDYNFSNRQTQTEVNRCLFFALCSFACCRRTTMELH